MADNRIPIVSTRTAGPTSPTVSLGSEALARGGRALSSGLGNVASTVTEAYRLRKEVRERNDLAQANISIAQAFQELNAEFKDIEDFEKAPISYRNRATQLKQSFLQGYSGDEEYMRRLSLAWDANQVAALDAFQQRVFKEEAVYRTAKTEEALTYHVNVAGTLGTIDDLKREIGSAGNLIDSTKPFMTEAQELAMRAGTRSSMYAAYIIGQAKKGQKADDALLEAREFMDPKTYTALVATVDDEYRKVQVIANTDQILNATDDFAQQMEMASTISNPEIRIEVEKRLRTFRADADYIENKKRTDEANGYIKKFYDVLNTKDLVALRSVISSLPGHLQGALRKGLEAQYNSLEADLKEKKIPLDPEKVAEAKAAIKTGAINSHLDLVIHFGEVIPQETMLSLFDDFDAWQKNEKSASRVTSDDMSVIRAMMPSYGLEDKDLGHFLVFIEDDLKINPQEIKSKQFINDALRDFTLKRFEVDTGDFWFTGGAYNRQSVAQTMAHSAKAIQSGSPLSISFTDPMESQKLQAIMKRLVEFNLLSANEFNPDSKTDQAEFLTKYFRLLDTPQELERLHYELMTRKSMTEMEFKALMGDI
jgi:hypothetical protein